MQVLVIGGNGFIGRHVATRLKRAGCIVAIAGRGVDFEPMLDTVEAVVDLASDTTPGSSQNVPTREINNIETCLRLAESLLDRPNVRLVYVSSGGTVYGNPSTELVAEDAGFAPLSFHGASKAASELFLGVLRAQGRQVVILRPANAYGPGQHLKSGFGFVRTVLEHAATGETLTIWGDGEAVRDFVYVEDVADAIVGAVRQPLPAGIFNVGSGIGHSLNQVVAVARSISARDIPVRYETPRAGDVARSVLHVEKLKMALGWSPSVGLEEGVSRTWDWLHGQRRLLYTGDK